METCDCCQQQVQDLPYNHVHRDSGRETDYCQGCYDWGCDLETCSLPERSLPEQRVWKFRVGEEVRVTGNTMSHGFEIGTIVRIVLLPDAGSVTYRARGVWKANPAEKISQWISESDLESTLVPVSDAELQAVRESLGESLRRGNGKSH